MMSTRRKTGRRRKKMTKALKVGLLSLTAIIVVLIVVAGMSIQAMMQKNAYEVNQMYSRKEDLKNQQLKLSQLVQELNQTLQAEIQRNALLQVQLSNIKQEGVAAQEQITGQIAAQEAAAAQAAAKAAAAPPPPPPQTTTGVVTRAS